MGFFFLALQLLPSIIGTVQQLHGSKPGPVKKAIVLDTVGQIAVAVGTTLTNTQKDELAAHTDSTVDMMKTGGVFVQR